MKRCLPMLCALCAMPMALAQSIPGSGPALPPAASAPTPPHIDSRCQAVHAGDVVHFTLRIESVQYARAVYADLQMHMGRTYVNDPSGLPPPDFQSLGGGGVATRDPQRGDLYHFTFTVPRDVMNGIYYGSGVYVTAKDNDDLTGSNSRSVGVNGRTMREVRDYCLIVVSPYGVGGRGLVTNFKGGPIERKISSTSSGQTGSQIYLPSR